MHWNRALQVHVGKDNSILRDGCWSSGRKCKFYPEFLSELLDNIQTISCQKRRLCYQETVLNPSPVDIFILLAYGRRFMFSSSSYFLNCAGQQVFRRHFEANFCVKSRARFRDKVIQFSSVQCWRLLYTDEIGTREVADWYHRQKHSNGVHCISESIGWKKYH